MSAESSGSRLFTPLEEELIAQWMCVMARVNLAVGRAEVIQRAREVLLLREGLLPVDVERIQHLTLHRWYRAFVRRQPGITQRTERLVTPARLLAETKVGSTAHFFTLRSQFKDYGATQIYAGDETGLTGDGTRAGKVWVQIGVKQVSTAKKRTQGHVGLTHIGTADGDSLPPLVSYAVKALTPEHVHGLPVDALVREQDNGHFVGKDFRAVLDHIIVHARRPGGVWDCVDYARPPLLFIVDGATSHTDYEALKWARDQRIDVLCLPANTTHLLQVADVALFGPFKHYWAAACRRVTGAKRSRTGAVKMDISAIVQCMMEAWGRAMTPTNVKNGFLRTGMFPIDPEAHKFFDDNRLASLGGLPQLVRADAQSLLIEPSVSSLVQSFNNAVPLPDPEPVKRRSKRLSTENGCLLTAGAVMASFEARAVEAERAAAAKAANREARETKRVAKAGEAAAKAAARQAAAAAEERSGAEIEAALAAARARGSRAAARAAERAHSSGESSDDEGPYVAPEAVMRAVLASRSLGPEEQAEGLRKWEQRQAEAAQVRERAAVAVAAAREAAAAQAAASAVEVGRPTPPLGDLTNVAGRGQKRKAAAVAETGKENGHGHNTRAKAAKGEGARRGLEAMLSISM